MKVKFSYPQEGQEGTSSKGDHLRQAWTQNASTLPRGFTPGYSRCIEELETVHRLLEASTEHLLQEYQKKVQEAGQEQGEEGLGRWFPSITSQALLVKRRPEAEEVAVQANQ
jgi:hypothetical protein